jgi:hypothetical protein
MSDIFREVDEDIRREQVKRLWDRFGPYVLGGAVLIVVLTAGYRGWEYWQGRQAAATGDRFLAALQLAGNGKHDEAIKALQGIIDNGSGGYPVLARFRLAGEKALAGDKTAAVAEFDAIAADRSASTEEKNMARLRAALLLVDTASEADQQSRIGDLAATGNPWRYSAREILGLAAWRAGDYVAARKYFDDINSDQDSATDLRQRAQLMLALIAARIGPEPAAAVAPASASGAAPPAVPAGSTAPATPTP